MFTSNKIGIIADDLTGANDTALQFHLRGCSTQILLDTQNLPDDNINTQAWAIPTESRNIDVQNAVSKVMEATHAFLNKFNIEYFYKKIDSTLRGNIAQEILTILNELKWDAAIILPAYPIEGRTTVGGYHLLKGVPIQRTELARDPHFPVSESHIPSILKKQLDDEYKNKNIIGLIPIDIVMKGAGPILMSLNALVKEGKKLIVVDAVSTIDIEQTVLAINKTNCKILPCGSAGLAQALANTWLDGTTENIPIHQSIPTLPKLIISGSATDLTASQIKKLNDSDEIENTFFIAVTAEDVLKNDVNSIVERALPNLIKKNAVIIHSSNITIDKKELSQYLFENEISESDFSSRIADFLALIAKKSVSEKEVVLITIGGETSYKCANTINSQNLQLITAVSSAIPLCLDHNAQWIVTKSGNLGNVNTLVEILKYFEQYDK